MNDATTGKLYTLKSETPIGTFTPNNAVKLVAATDSDVNIPLKTVTGLYQIPEHNGLILKSISLQLPYSYGFAECGAASVRLAYYDGVNPPDPIPELESGGFTSLWIPAPNVDIDLNIFLSFQSGPAYPYWIVVQDYNFDIATVNGPDLLNGESLPINFVAKLISTENLES